MPKLTISLPDDSQITNDLESDRLTLGRADDNDIVITDASVSGHHAEITKSGSGHRIIDLGSTNGTSVNGKSIEEADLNEGDQLIIGHLAAQYGDRTASTAPSGDSATGAGAAAAAGAGAGAAGAAASSSTKSADEIAAAWDDDDTEADDMMSSSPAGLESSGASFGAKEKSKDPMAALLMTLGCLALVACLLAILFVFTQM